MSTYTLRPYQAAAVASVWEYLQAGSGRRPLIVAPTGAGKSIILAQLCRELIVADPGCQIVVATHVKELVEQNAEKLAALIGPGAVGVHSAGLRRRDTDERVIVGGVQSLVNRIAELGPRHVVIVDEAHRIPRDGQGQYQQLIAALNAKVLIGLTATPYRMDSGYLHTGDGAMFDGICYDINMVDLIEQGHLSRLRPIKHETDFDLSAGRIARGDFVIEGELQAELESVDIIEAIVDEWEKLALAKGRNATLAFCASVAQAQTLADAISSRSHRVALVTAATSDNERAEHVEAFRSGGLDVLVNVGVFTTGFDAPNVDCLLVLRPMASTGLYVQVMGRGMRTNEGKADCLVLDYGKNVERHGPVNCVTVNTKKSGSDPAAETPRAKTCQSCESLVAIQARQCEFCGFVFPVLKARDRRPQASTSELIDMGEPIDLIVQASSPVPHISAAGNACVRIDHWARAREDEAYLCYSEWFVLGGDKGAFGRHNLSRVIGRPVPVFGDDMDAACAWIREQFQEHGYPETITVKREGKYVRVLRWTLGEPEPVPFLSDEECPF